MTTDANDIKALKYISGFLDDQKAEDIKILDIRDIINITDFFVIATSFHDQHNRACCDYLRRKLKEKDIKIFGIEGYNEGKWILINSGFVMIHLFTLEIREYYTLDRLYADAPRLSF